MLKTLTGLGIVPEPFTPILINSHLHQQCWRNKRVTVGTRGSQYKTYMILKLSLLCKPAGELLKHNKSRNNF